MKIFLIGLPGSGKTTLGKEVALSLNIPFIDLDVEIEKETGTSVSEIFKNYGEDHFRQLESDQLKKRINSSTGFVMATGGGTPCFFDHVNWMKKAGRTIFLDVPVEEIIRRIKTTYPSHRPLLSSRDPVELKDKLELMRSGRLSWYQQAHVTLSGIAVSSQDVRDYLMI